MSPSNTPLFDYSRETIERSREIVAESRRLLAETAHLVKKPRSPRAMLEEHVEGEEPSDAKTD